MLLTIVLLDALSRHLEDYDPARALSLYPLNTEARVALLKEALNDLDAPVGQRLRSTALRGLALDPVDARFYSILAELYLRNGDEDKARTLFHTAHQISHTEHHALRNLIRIAVQHGAYGEAVRTADILFRRWPEQFDELSEFVATLVAEDEGYDALLELADLGFPWRARLMDSLVANDNYRYIAHRLLLDLQSSENRPSRAERAALINEYWRQRAYVEAYRLFLMTLSEDERSLTGFVHNHSFSPVQEPVLFAWNYRSTPAAEIRLSSAPAPYNGATIRFRDRPAREIVLRQNLMLPEGRYNLLVEASAFTLRAPRDIFLIVKCVRPTRELLRLRIPEGNYRSTSFELDFPVADCPAQTIGLETGLVAESWRHRYSGQVVLHSVTIKRAGVEQDRG